MERQFIAVLVTSSSLSEAESICKNLLDEKLIACANVVGPVISHFHWGGKAERAEEFLIIMKSRRDLFDKLSSAVTKLHSYEVPEIIALPITAGSKGYLDWLNNSLVQA